MNLDPLAILNALPEATLLRDAAGVVIHVNPAAERLLQVSAADVVGGRDLPYVLAEELATGGRFDVHLDSRRWFEVEISPCGPTGLESSTSLAVYHDMTAIQDLYLSIHYELRGLLTPVQGFTELLLLGAGGALNDKQKEMAQIAVSSSKRVLAYMEAVLSYARIARQWDIVLRPEHININDLIDSVFESANRQQWTLARENSYIFGDKRKLFDVFWFLKFQASYDAMNMLSVQTRAQFSRITIEIKIEGYVYEPLWAYGPRDLCERILAAHGGTFDLDVSTYEICACTITLPIASEPPAS
jgi:signal transduction histidine kinase